MRRREFLQAGSAALLLAGAPRAWAAKPSPVGIRLDPENAGFDIPPDFMGLGYEISSAATPGLLAASNAPYVQLVKTLSPKGVIRVGGNTADFSSYAPDGAPLAVPKGTVINRKNLEDLGSFLAATGWTLIWALNLGEGSVKEAVETARAVTQAVGDRLIGFEIGNEPDLFKVAGHRSGAWGYADWLAAYRRYKAAIRQALPNARFIGPDVAGAPSTSWVADYARDEGHDAVMLTHHYYVGSSNQPGATMEKMLTDTKIGDIGAQIQAAAKPVNLPWRICETNSYSGGGKGGVSDSLGAALWTLDFMFALASKGCGGVNMETGVNHVGFISSYSPILGEYAGTLAAAPEYYGMLAFAHAGRGKLIGLDLDAGGLNCTAYATRDSGGDLLVTIINKEENRDAAVTIDGASGTGDITRLTGPSLAAVSGVHFGGAAVDKKGDWQSRDAAKIAAHAGHTALHVPAASAAILRLRA